jgi:hypothetical protein
MRSHRLHTPADDSSSSTTRVLRPHSRIRIPYGAATTSSAYVYVCQVDATPARTHTHVLPGGIACTHTRTPRRNRARHARYFLTNRIRLTFDDEASFAQTQEGACPRSTRPPSRPRRFRGQTGKGRCIWKIIDRRRGQLSTRPA